MQAASDKNEQLIRLLDRDNFVTNLNETLNTRQILKFQNSRPTLDATHLKRSLILFFILLMPIYNNVTCKYTKLENLSKSLGLVRSSGC